MIPTKSNGAGYGPHDPRTNRILRACIRALSTVPAGSESRAFAFARAGSPGGIRREDLPRLLSLILADRRALATV